jgi:hypothetical protein
MAEITTVALKTYKTSNVWLKLYYFHPNLMQMMLQSSILRYNALVALRKSLMTAKKAVTDSVSKDIIKQMKSGINDKSLPVQRAATDV